MGRTTTTEVEGHRLELSNLDKVLFPSTGFTKGQLIDYYVKVAPFILGHLRDRPLTLKRYPDGVDGPYFFQKECPDFHPEWLETIAVPSPGSTRGRGVVDFCSVSGLAGLVWVENLASLELHTMLCTSSDIDRPDFVVFDIDPGSGVDLAGCARAALELKAMLDDLGLECFPKTSGKKGIHVYAPLNTQCTFDDTKAFAHGVARSLEEERPNAFTSNMRKSQRGGKTFIDWSQNDRHKTTVCVYSIRAVEQPTVSTPVTWDELQQAADSGRPEALVFSTDDVIARTRENGDLFAGVLSLEQELPIP